MLSSSPVLDSSSITLCSGGSIARGPCLEHVVGCSFKALSVALLFGRVNGCSCTSLHYAKRRLGIKVNKYRKL